MSMTDFGDPIAVKAEDMPAATARGGRESNVPALAAWLEKVAAANPGTYELRSKDPDGAHTTLRGGQLKKIVRGEMDGVTPSDAVKQLKIETRAVVSGKRYRVFATKEAPAANGKPGARK